MRKKNKNRGGLFLLAVLLLLAQSPGTSFAYLIAEDGTENTFTAGRKEVEIQEEFTPKPLVPGVEITKKVRLVNTGNVPVYVRAAVTFSDSDMEKLCEELDYNREDWELKDGFWHYRSVLQPGESTSCLFTTVKIREDAPENELKDFEIYVFAESVLWEGHEEEDYLSVWK